MTVSGVPARIPNYDLPSAAPPPLRQVQLFVNTADRERGTDWLGEWLAAHGLGEPARARAAALREALRALLRANSAGGAPPPEAVGLLDAAARSSVTVGLDPTGVVLAGADPLGEVVAIALRAMLDGTWPRLKACRACEWSFWDASKNRSGTWCSMRLCGNRLKTRAYRRRRAAR